jgi:hypothetical protein
MGDGETQIKQYAIYERPTDYPEGYVVREWLVTSAGAQPGQSWRAATLEAARDLLPAGTERVAAEDPDPAILEVWM